MKQTRVAALACGLAALGLVVVLAAIAGFFYIAAQGWDARPLTEKERKLLIDPAALAALGAKNLDAGAVTCQTTRNIDRTRELECTHDKNGLYFSTAAEVDRSKRGARETFRILVVGYKAGVVLGDAQLVAAPTLLGSRSGDERFAGYIRKNGEIVGNVFAIRQGRVVHTLLLTGIYLSEREDAEALFAPLLEESRRY